MLLYSAESVSMNEDNLSGLTNQEFISTSRHGESINAGKLAFKQPEAGVREINALSRNKAERETRRALEAYEKANEHYSQVIQKYVSTGFLAPGEPVRRPGATFDANGFKEIDRAWLKVNNAGKKLRQAYLHLWETSH